MYDTCNAEKSEVALCSVLSTYSRDCASAGVSLQGWRQGVCGMYENWNSLGRGMEEQLQNSLICGSQCLLSLVIKSESFWKTE